MRGMNIEIKGKYPYSYAPLLLEEYIKVLIDVHYFVKKQNAVLYYFR